MKNNTGSKFHVFSSSNSFYMGPKPIAYTSQRGFIFPQKQNPTIYKLVRLPIIKGR